MKRNVVINREYGSGGRKIGKLVAEELHMPFYDSRILEASIGKNGMTGSFLETFDEKVIGSFLYTLSMAASGDRGAMEKPYKMYGAIADTIKGAAMLEPCVFIGRCADQILKDANIPFINVFIYATNKEEKIQRAIAEGVPSEKAENYIYKKDKARRGYQDFFTHTKFGVYTNYDMCLNSSRLGYEKCAQVIINAMDL